MATITIRPNRIPRWNSGGANRVEPPEGEKTLGNIFGAVANSSYYNWLFNLYYQWQAYSDNFPSGVIPPGLYALPTITAAAGPIFSIGAFTLLTVDGKRLDVDADTFIPVPAPSPELVNPYRLDGIYARYTEPALADPTVEYIYIEDISGYDPPAGDYPIAWIAVENNVAYTIGKFFKRPKIDLVGNRITISDGIGDPIGSNEVTIAGIQEAISSLAGNGGGFIDIVGDDFGKEFYTVISSLAMKSGVTVNFNGSHLYPALVGENPITLNELVKFEGASANATIQPYPSPGNVFICGFVGWDWDDYGQLSLIEITTGVIGERGFYLIDEIISDSTVVLVDMSRDPVVLTAENKSFRIYIYNAQLKNIQIDTTRSGADFSGVEEAAILFDYTYDCKAVDIFNKHEGSNLFAAYRLLRNNYNPKIIRPTIRGYIINGIYAPDMTVAPCENILIEGHLIDRDVAAAGKDINIVGAAIGLGGRIGNGQTNGTSTIPSNFGWKAYPENVEHEIDGTHSHNIIDTAELVDEAVVPLILGDQSLWLLASFSCNLAADGPMTDFPSREIQKAKDGTLETIEYLGGAPFDVITVGANHPWQVRRIGAGGYQVRPPVAIIAGPIVTPKYIPDDVTVFVSIGVTQNITNRLGYDSGANHYYWQPSFRNIAGAATDSEFQITFMSSK